MIKRFTWAVGWIVCAVACSAGGAGALDLEWEPGLYVVTTDEVVSASVFLREAVAVRTIDVVIEGDPDLLLEMSASPGSLFSGLPGNCMIWEESEILAPGRWHGFAVIIGATCETVGPGELLRWEFVAGPTGSTFLRTVEVSLYAPDGSLIPDVALGDAEVLINTVSHATQPPRMPELGLYPNPFNPATVVNIDLPEASEATVTVHDLRGRRIGTVWAGPLPAGITPINWHARTRNGAELSSGIYFFVLEAGGVRATVRGLLLR